MFAIVYYGIIFISKGIVYTKNKINDFKSKEDAKRNRRIGYWTSDGLFNDINNDQPIYYAIDHNGDQVLKNWNGEVVRNVSEQHRLKLLEKHNDGLSNTIKAIGRYLDFYPSNGTCKFKNIPRNACIYENNTNHRLIKLKMNSLCSQDSFVNLSTGEFIMLKEQTDKDKEWLTKQNKKYCNKDNQGIIDIRMIELL